MWRQKCRKRSEQGRIVLWRRRGGRGTAAGPAVAPVRGELCLRLWLKRRIAQYFLVDKHVSWNGLGDKEKVCYKRLSKVSMSSS